MHHHTDSTASTLQRILIVGMGPVGLLTALDMARVISSTNHTVTTAAPRISLIDKRLDYKRNVWFDLYAEPYATSMKTLYNLGLHLLPEDAIEKEIQHLDNGRQLWTVRCQILERLLYWYLLEVHVGNEAIHESIQMLRGWKFAGYKQRDDSSPLHWRTDGSTFLAKLAASSSNAVKLLPFDLLIGVDGANSEVRKQTPGIQTQAANMFDVYSTPGFHSQPPARYVIEAKDLYQLAIIVNFLPETESTTNGNSVSCPQIQMDPETNQKINPWKPSFIHKGVTAVFKRFYSPNKNPHCHLQILLDNELATSILRAYNTTGELPWKLIHSVSNTILEQKSPSIQHLQSRLLMRKSKKHLNPSYNVDMIPVRVRYASPVGVWLPSMKQAVILHGDSSINAHFRLGIGVNNGFNSLYNREFGELLTQWQQEKQLTEKVFETLLRKVTHRVDAMRQYQLKVMFFESFCSVDVFPDNSFHSTMYYVKDGRSFQEISVEEAIYRCQQRNGEKFRVFRARPE